jgi:hypothetical protein
LSHTFERSQVHAWAEQQQAHPGRPYKIKVAVVSNKEADRVKRRHLFATAVHATTVVDIPVAEVLASVARSIVKDTGPWICKNQNRIK